MKYLENNICDFEILFNYTNIRKNIISLSFFKMYNGGYKDFNLYINGFFKLHDYVLKEKNITLLLDFLLIIVLKMIRNYLIKFIILNVLKLLFINVKNIYNLMIIIII